MDAIEWIRDVGRSNGDRQFLIDTVTAETITYAELDIAARAVGADLRRRGIGKGDRVAMILNNSAAFAKLCFGCLYAGIVAVPVNPVLSRGEIAAILRHCNARLVIVSRETTKDVVAGDAGADGCEFLLLDDGRGADGPDLDQAGAWRLSDLEANDGFKPFDRVTPDDTMTIVFTSGTTSTPSGVTHRIRDMIDNARLFNQRLGIGPHNRFFNVLAMTYLGGYYNLLMLPYAAGASVVLADAFGARSVFKFWQTAIEHDVNTLWFPPTIMAILMELDRGKEGEQFCRDHVELALVGMAPLAVNLRRKFEDRYGIELYENFGLSETFFISTNAPMLPRIDGSVGRAMPGVDVTVLSPSGSPLPYGEEGEICVSTPYLMEGYFDVQSGEVERLEAGSWFATGDIGVLSATGELFITGRKKDLIIRGGINISPAAIEDVLFRSDSVAECAVVGVPHRLHGEEIAAVVRLADGYMFADVRAELLAECKRELSEIKQPAHLLDLEEFPRSTSGKIQKHKVRDLVIQKLGLEDAAAEAPVPSLRSNEPPPMVAGRVRRNVARPPQALVREIAKYPTGIISDCMNRMGVMDASIRPLTSGRPFCGTALTVDEVEAGNMMSHAALEMIQPGDVLVIDAKGTTTRACFGGLQLLKAKEMGAVAIVANGTVRDFQDFVDLEVPVYALGLSPGGPMKGWGGNINYPIACGGVVVEAGDMIVGDDDGIVVIPKAIAEMLPPMCERRSTLEEKWFEAVRAGESTLDAVNLRQGFEKLGIRFD